MSDIYWPVVHYGAGSQGDRSLSLLIVLFLSGILCAYTVKPPGQDLTYPLSYPPPSLPALPPSVCRACHSMTVIPVSSVSKIWNFL